jgi:predicted metal-binding membrane protein
MSAWSSKACHLPAVRFPPSPLPREGWVVGLLLLALLCAAWAWLFRMDALGQILICRAQGAAFSTVAGMWIVMMTAMMLPSALPMIVTYSQVSARRERALSRGSLVAVFAGVYLVVWSAFGAAAAAAEWLLQGEGFIRAGQLASPLHAGVCLSRCRSPLGFLLEHYRSGYGGALVLGLAHGAFCVGCCWVLMLLAWVGGAMNLAWMVVLTLLVAAERLLRPRVLVVRATALTLLSAGVVLILNSALA